MKSPERAALRHYAACFGFEGVAATLDASKTEYVVHYGSLDLDGVLFETGSCEICEIPGTLYEVGDDPALKLF